MIPRDPPLVPSPDDARADLRRELLGQEYQQDLLSRILGRLRREFLEALDAAAGISVAGAAAALVVLFGLALAFIWLLTRARAQAAAPGPGPLLGEEAVAAAELRRRAEEALADGRYADAVVDGVRALTVRQVELGRLEDVPGATAREVAGWLADAAPPLRTRLDDLATTFDGVLYGKEPAAADDVRRVLALDDDLAGAR